MNYNLLMKYCLTEINKISKSKHKKYNSMTKYSNEYYLKNIFFMLNELFSSKKLAHARQAMLADINNWKFL